MCVLKAFSSTQSFKKFAEATPVPIYSLMEKGQIKNQGAATTYSEHRISFDVSDRDWDDLPGQVEDAVRFLNQWESELQTFISEFKPDEVLLDFPLYSRISEEIVNQNDYLPSELIKVAGRLGVGIGMSIYVRDAVDDL